MGTVRFHLDDLHTGRCEIEGDEVRHARVRRLEVGRAVEILDGAGHIGSGEIVSLTRHRLEVDVREIREVPRTAPVLEILGATPKGTRVDGMIDGLAQLGAASWSPLECARAVVDPRASKLERLRRLARESSKQCGRAWDLEIGSPRRFDDAIGEGVLLCDASGDVMPRPEARVTVLVGPEGGWTPEELDRAREAGCRFVRLAPHVLRIERACEAASALVMQPR